MDINNFFSLEKFFHKKLFALSKTLWDPLLLLNDYLQSIPIGRELGTVAQGAFISEGAVLSVGKGTIVEPGVFIDGICVIGEGVHVRSGAYIRGNAIIGDRCVIGHGTEVKHSIILNDTHVPHFSYVGDSILGNGVNLGAGTICSNFRLDGKPISIRVDGKKETTGLRKLGGIIGDRVQIGCKCVLNPGTVIGPDAICYPGLILSGSYKEKSLIKKGL